MGECILNEAVGGGWEGSGCEGVSEFVSEFARENAIQTNFKLDDDNEQRRRRRRRRDDDDDDGGMKSARKVNVKADARLLACLLTSLLTHEVRTYLLTRC